MTVNPRGPYLIAQRVLQDAPGSAVFLATPPHRGLSSRKRHGWSQVVSEDEVRHVTPGVRVGVTGVPDQSQVGPRGVPSCPVHSSRLLDPPEVLHSLDGGEGCSGIPGLVIRAKGVDQIRSGPFPHVPRTGPSSPGTSVHVVLGGRTGLVRR